ncbi:MAG TPA: PQQ-binding-like beta-propeller repeat protein [Steroidobacteraceae bacterium]|jgi:alcohol dehydrogenase (cytochrome c)|nr:PQQ-binding-like beta-propeller repeat protein [Steroidobacteraceae bacterium]
MRDQLPVSSTQISFPISKYAIALLCCAFNIHPLVAHENLDWRYHGRDVSNQRFQDVDQINPSNVANLKPAWIFHTGVSDPNMSMEMTPIVVDGVMYVTTGDDDVFALHAATGKQIWAYHPTDMPSLSSLPICCNNDNRGVAIGHGKVFNARLDATLVALDAKSGKVVWKTTVDLPSNGASMTLAPQFADNKVIVGVSGAEFGVRGHLDAYDPDTGKLVWRFWTTEPSSWAGDTYLHGGASVWGNPSYDPDLHMLYFSTGNAYPWPWAGDRAGTNLYSSSIVALDVRNGELKWYFQDTHHDLWDFDGPQPTVLFDFHGTPALSHTSKTGYMFILDRRTGQSLHPYKEVPVPTTPVFQHPWPTQPESSIESLTEHHAEALPPGFIAAPQWTPVQPTPLVFQPIFDGGMEWPPAAYSPRTHFVYSHARYVPADIGITDNPAGNANCPTSPTCTFEFIQIPGVTNHGVYGAVDTRTGKVAWRIPVITTAPDSGVAVAGDLVFFGDSTGLFHAADAKTGEILWTFDSSTVPNAGGANGSPAIYVVNGREYVVYGFGGNPGESPVLGDAVIAFALPHHDDDHDDDHGD